MMIRGKPLTIDRIRNSIRWRISGLMGRHSAPPAQHWVRRVMNNAVERQLEGLSPRTLEAVEISGQNHAHRSWKSYVSCDYPEFDLCNPPKIEKQYDIVLCEQVLEHVVDPWRATRTLHDLVRPGGHVLVTTPFLYRLHLSPDDYWRFTPHGMEVLLQSSGLDVVVVGAWGNRASIRASFQRDPPYRFWRSLRNDSELPVVIWAMARRPRENGTY